ncbi:MAG: hypothetical protein HY561_02835 [Gemmatimonadetes bacterium]|nr:hypothetical protein [Gemmatimonadota bacterium]
MAERVLVLFDDAVARDWQPFTLTRPAGELLFGTLTLRERAERVFGLRCMGCITEPSLRSFAEADAPPVIEPAALPRDAEVLFWSARAVPDWGPGLRLDGPRLLALGDEVCGLVLPAGADPPAAGFFLDPTRAAPAGVAVTTLAGTLLGPIWQLVSRQAEQTAHDIRALHPLAKSPELPAGVHALGSEPLVLGEGVRLEPGVIFDLHEGPIWLDQDVEVRAFTRLAGPAFVGRNSILLGGSCAAIAVGPVCRVHGEMEETVVLGYSNKAHDGFLGHAYLGRWVNLGALTNNSDLKNNYGPVRLWTPRGEQDTGEIKLGCFLGDHVKTGIGTLLSTGTVVGTGSNIFGAAMPPKYVPPFSWGTGEALGEYELEKFLKTAETVMGRRKVTLTAEQRELLRAAWQRGRGRTG